MTQSDLAAVFGISDKAVSKWERGLSTPSENNLKELVGLLGLPAEYLPVKSQSDKRNGNVFSVIKQELFLILGTGLIIASAVCLSLGLLSVESAVLLTGASCAAIAFVTMFKES